MRKKQLDVEEFSIYWDVDCTLLGDLPQVELQVGVVRALLRGGSLEAMLWHQAFVPSVR